MPAVARTVTLAGVVVASLAVRQASGFSGLAAESLPALVYAFVPGVLLAVYREELQGLAADRAHQLRVAAVAVAAAAFVALLTAEPDGEGIRGIFYLVISGSFVAAVMLGEWHRPSGFLVRSRIVNAIGRWSYGVYLWHPAVGAEAARAIPEGASAMTAFAVLLPLTVVGSLLVGAASWRFVEAPALALARRRHPVEAPTAAIPGPGLTPQVPGGVERGVPRR